MFMKKVHDDESCAVNLQGGRKVPFTFTRMDIPDVILVEPRAFGDDRGFFMETYRGSEFENGGITAKFVQDNYSHSSKGVLRGLHYQMDPNAQGKLVFVVRGEIFDVAVDIRQKSPTFGKWVAAVLSEENHRLLFVPEGFAHGFLVTSAEADVVYKVTSEYAPDKDRGIMWDDPVLGVDWPSRSPSLSAKDKQHPYLQDADINFTFSA